ncbi:MAG: aminotransferase class I/II-fold pyridoxal phosphate-dependent enzyme [Cyanobacteria bacterium P01_C01_bin.70]
MDDLSTTPLLTAIAIAAARNHTAFYAPGHKQGQGASALLRDLLGASALQADLPELPELDNLFAPSGPIAQAQALAASTFGAEATYFLANGTTCGLEAALLAVSYPGAKVLVPRNAHQSVLSALILSGAQPLYLTPVYDPQWDLAFGITASQVEQAWQTHPDIQAVVAVSPSYHGVCSNLAAIAQCAHQHNAVLLVDEAHGPHLAFHLALPSGAIAAGADIAVQSTHKVLGALTQASMLHVQGTRIDRDRLSQALQLTQSTSPNYLLLASLDAARHQMATAGKALMARTMAIAQHIREHLRPLAALTVLNAGHLPAQAPDFQLDPTRLVVDVAALGMTGLAADEFLHEQQRVTAELPTLRQLAFILSLGNTLEDGDRLVAALKALMQQAAQLPQTQAAAQEISPSLSPAFLTQPPMTPREAFFASAATVPIADAVGAIAIETVCPYPPGIPLLLPGEVITAAAIAQIQQIRNAGGVLTGNPDPDWQTLRVVSHR